MEKMHRSGLDTALARLAGTLCGGLLRAALPEAENTRYEAGRDLLIDAVWDGFLELPGLPSIDAEDKMFEIDLGTFLERIEERVFAVFEGVFPDSQQCDALKRQARGQIKDIWYIQVGFPNPRTSNEKATTRPWIR